MIHNICNYWKNEMGVETFPSEDICPECKGAGVKKLYSIGPHPFGRCGRCKGEGKIDWIKKAMRP